MAGEIQYGKIAKTICVLVVSMDADLVVLATHGKAGTQVLWDNSIAAQLQGQANLPLLLVPV